MVPWSKQTRSTPSGPSLARVLFGRQAAIFLGTAALSLLLFLLFVQMAFLTLWDSLTPLVRQEIERQADTISRLLVFEFSHLSALESQSEADPALEQLIKRLLWEKVTFNDTIRGIELISRQTDAEGRHLSYSFFPLSYEESETEQAPRKSWRAFPGPEGELLRLLIREQRVDRTLLEIVNQGRKLESELLLRYFPLYIPLPERGAVFWGVVKVGVSIDAMRRFLLLLDEERTILRRILLAGMAGTTVLALLLGLLGFRWQSRGTAALLAGYADLAAALREQQGMDPVSLETHLQEQETRGIRELQALQELLLHLTRTLQGLAARLVASEGQAGSGRLLSAALQNLAASPTGRPVPTGYADLFRPREASWEEVDLEPSLQEISQLLRALLPPGTAFREVHRPVAPVPGCHAHLLVALLLLVDFALTTMAAEGELHYQAGPGPTGGLEFSLSFAGPVFADAELDRLRRPFQAADPAAVPLGPYLAAAIAAQHGGTLIVSPRPQGGLTLTFQVPGPSLPHPLPASG